MGRFEWDLEAEILTLRHRLMCYAEKCAGSRGISRQRLRLELGTTLCQLTRELGSVRWNRMMQDDGEFAN